MSLGSNIKKFRKELGITQEELAGLLFVTSQAVSKWESEAGLPDTAQIVPLAKALNVSTDALFGIGAADYDEELAKKIEQEANSLRDGRDQIQGAVAAADFLMQKCEENPFNYGILMRYVQSIAHMSRFVNYNGLFGEEKDAGRWQNYVKAAKNRALQVIRYAEDKELVDKCHYAMAWIYWHEKEFDKGREHLNALPSIKNNMLRETIDSYYESADKGMDAWRDSVRDNLQNFIRAMNKQLLYCGESSMLANEPGAVDHCKWALGIMEQFMLDERMRAYCQGYYRDTAKFMVAAYLRNGKVEEAAAAWKALICKIDSYVEYCEKVSAENKESVVAKYGKKAQENMAHYTRAFADEKIAFMLGQLKSWCDGESWAKFEKLVE
ncbi:MAG: helix-turn-helix domain-containing protein [Treponema sp.]|nr:helix-turn-helix domain-containing protein [Treponema sp.]